MAQRKSSFVQNMEGTLKPNFQSSEPELDCSICMSRGASDDTIQADSGTSIVGLLS